MCIAGGEICFATMDGSGAHEESIMARNLRSETEEILNENIDKSYGFTCIIGYLVFYDFDDARWLPVLFPKRKLLCLTQNFSMVT